MSDDSSPTIPVGRCPICNKPAVVQHRPFCSRRCALVDLSRWIGGNYRVPLPNTNDEEEERAPPGEDEAE